MRALALALPLAALLGAAARAGEPETIDLRVGDETADLGVAPRCDDLKVVAVKESGRGVRGLRPGTTVCSFDTSGGGGIRRVVRIVVRAPVPRGAPAADAGKAGAGAKPATQ